MASGYTADVASGKITDFTEYALQCARAFGACIMLRDEPLSSEIPEFSPSDYHAERLVESEKALADFLAMDASQRQAMHAKEHAKHVADADKWIAEKKVTLSRYNAMLEKAMAFEPPSAEHQQYAKFLVDQLTSSIECDCDESYYTELKQEVPFVLWEAAKISSLERSVEYHRNEHQQEVERTSQRNRWISQLKEALSINNEVASK